MKIKTFRCYGCRFPCECHIFEGENLPPCPYKYDTEWIAKGSIAELKEIEEHCMKDDIQYVNVNRWYRARSD